MSSSAATSPREAAEEDYNAVFDCSVHLLGAVVVSKDLEGNLTVEQTDHMVAEGAAGLGASVLSAVCDARPGDEALGLIQGEVASQALTSEHRRDRRAATVS